jgi:hypothetical protein
VDLTRASTDVVRTPKVSDLPRSVARVQIDS